MSAPELILAYVLILLGGLSLLVIYTEMRRRRFEPPAVRDRIFRCNNCGAVYTDDPDVDLSRCSHCGKFNPPFEF
ncbi:MAG: hypothetical protein RMN51_12035 [Verrucomicrobiota bacterium]|nr:hydrogenase maturation nickel metallochaperone HypA [Limisphaera sp.]MDW8382820.1 hypothetical protein [Verrucomicrobiota bacterium]